MNDQGATVQWVNVWWASIRMGNVCIVRWANVLRPPGVLCMVVIVLTEIYGNTFRISPSPTYTAQFPVAHHQMIQITQPVSSI